MIRTSPLSAQETQKESEGGHGQRIPGADAWRQVVGDLANEGDNEPDPENIAAWTAARWGNAVWPFGFTGRGCGCLTQIKQDHELHGDAPTPEISEAIRADERIPAEIADFPSDRAGFISTWNYFARCHRAIARGTYPGL